MKKYKLFTFGGAGRSIAHALVNSNTFLYEEQGDILYHFNTDRYAVASSTLLKNKYFIGEPGLLPGPPGMEYIKKAFEDNKKVFEELTNDDLFYLLIGGFSGYTGGGLLIKVSELLSQKFKRFAIIGSVPFRFEGVAKLQKSYNVIDILKRTTDNIIILPYENLHNSLDSLTIPTAFTMADYYVIEAIHLILDLKSPIIDEQVSNILRNDDEISETIKKVKAIIN